MRTLPDTQRHEEGFTMIAVIALVAISSVLMIAFTISVRAAGDRSLQRANRVLDMPQLENAVNTYQGGLQSDAIGEANRFTLTEPTMIAASNVAAGDVVVSNSDPEIPLNMRDVQGVYQGGQLVTPMPVDARYSMRQKLPLDAAEIAAGRPQRFGYWQVYRIEMPDYDDVAQDANLVVYFRGWVQSSSTTPTTSSIARAEYRPGRFADYQILTDGQLVLGGGIQIDGPIHSNGLNALVNPSNPGLMIWNSGDVTCDPTAVVSTTNGAISLPASCATATGGYVSFLRTQESFNRIRLLCDDDPADTVYCFPPKLGVYSVVMSGNRTYVDGVPYRIGRVSGMLFNDDVKIHGDTLGRLTIAAERGDTRTAAASITIDGNVGISGNGSTMSDTLGLIAEGDIVVGLNTSGNACAVSSINAAMVAMSGKLTIPREWTSLPVPSGAPLCMSPLKLSASIASHDALKLVSNSSTTSGSTVRTTYTGYYTRRYAWDQRFHRNPPPFFPLTDQWQVANWRDANEDCLTSRSADSRCR